MNNELKQKFKNNLGKIFLKLINNSAFHKTIENVIKHTLKT